MQHILGDIISPPIIGAISDGTGSLQNGLQLTWVAIMVAGMFWFAGYYFLPPLNLAATGSEGSSSRIESTEIQRPAVTYRDILCGGTEPFVKVDGEIVMRFLVRDVDGAKVANELPDYTNRIGPTGYEHHSTAKDFAGVNRL